MLLLDNSAWSRMLAGTLPQDRGEMVIGWLDRSELGVCLPFLLEAGFSARSATDRARIMGRLGHLPHVAIESEVEHRALEAQRELAVIGHHRLSPVDIMIAACAHEAAAGVLHYDRDYDLIAEHTELRFESVWVAEAGRL